MIAVLYVDDDPALLNLCRIYLERTGDFRVDILDSATSVPRMLNERAYDAIISDYQMPEMDGIELLKTLRSRGNEIPFILFTGRGREEVVIEALNNGADFYLQKGGPAKAQFAELAHKIRQAVGKRKTEEELRASEKRISDIIDFLPDPVFAINLKREVIAWNRAMEDLTGVPASDMVGKGDYEYALPLYGNRRPVLIDLIFEPEHCISHHYSGIIRENDVFTAESMALGRNGEPIILMCKASPLFNPKGDIVGAIESIRDITPQKKNENHLRTAYEEISAAEEELRGQFDALADSERSLRESESRFRHLSETMTASIFVFKTKILYANPAAETLTGYSMEEIHGMDFWEFVHPVFKERVKDHGIRMPDCEQRPHRNIFKIVRKSGEERWVNASTTQIRFDGVPAVISIIVDITEQKLVTDRLFRLYQTFRHFRSDPQKNIDMVTALAGEYLSGSSAFYCRLENAQMRCIGQWNPQQNPVSLDSLESDLLDGVNSVGEDLPIIIRHPRDAESCSNDDPAGDVPVRTCVSKAVKIGESYCGLLSVLFDEDIIPEETDLEFLSILANATAIEDERWQTHESLLDSMDKYRGLFELGSEAIFLVDAETGRLLEANEAASEMYGYSHEELLSMKNTDISAEPEMTLAFSRQPVLGRVSAPLRFHKKKDGTIFPVEINSRFFIWGGRRIYISAIHDISARRRADNALRHANEKLNLLNSITRHDVVNQLTVLQGYTQLALLRNPDPVTEDFLKKIESVSDTIARQIRFTGMYQELGVHAPGWHNLDETLSRVRPKEILFSCSCGNMEIYADPMLTNVFSNLFDNALRHGERVTRISIRCETSDEDFVIFVEDNGVGIPLDIKQKIFEKGFGKHTGFGLFLVREILAITGISIHETGKHGTGARFEISVPKGGYRKGPGQT